MSVSAKKNRGSFRQIKKARSTPFLDTKKKVSQIKMAEHPHQPWLLIGKKCAIRGFTVHYLQIFNELLDKANIYAFPCTYLKWKNIFPASRRRFRCR